MIKLKIDDQGIVLYSDNRIIYTKSSRTARIYSIAIAYDEDRCGLESFGCIDTVEDARTKQGSN
jgi:hypothetical protein